MVAEVAVGVLGVLLAALVLVLLRTQRARLEAEARASRSGTPDQVRSADAQSQTAAPPRAPRARVARVVPPLPDELVDALGHDECILFAGGGVAASAGYPSWREVLTGLAQRAARFSEEPLGDALMQQLEVGQNELVAQILSGRLDAATTAAAIADVFETKGRHHDDGLLEVLVSVPFAGVVTDDYSNVIPQAFAARDPSLFTLESLSGQAHLLRENRFFLLQAYGAISDPQTICLSFGDYSRRMNELRESTLFLGALFGTRTILFVGTSVGGIEQFCIASGVRARGRREHFALVPDQVGTSLEAERLLTRYGVRLLPYDAEEGHGPVREFVGTLGAAARRYRPDSMREPDRLERVELTNIGPFEHLDLTFDQDWNVLLGDNAVGKTTILRAVALGLAGDSRATAIAPVRLLRAGSDAGTIVLTMGRSSYRTMISREGDVVAASSEQIAPVQSGASLAVGLPALRGTTQLGSQSGRTFASPNPSPTDILPLLRDEVDGRLDDIKEWIADHWLRSRDPTSGDGPRHKQILNAFFRILQELTPGVDFKFVGVDAKSNRICIETPDGEISLDDLSLGMVAMIGGIGVLLQRLYDVYPEDEAPERRTALLLIDEIDAHLHPKWQTRLLPALREAFPNLHLLATTHSPLIVANAAGGELHYLRRVNGRIVADRLEAPFQGWRADQILTGPAFEMDTTMDRDTAAKLKDYQRLQSLAAPSHDEQLRVRELAEDLGATVPGPQETAAQREASRLLEEWLTERLRGAMTPEAREELARQVQTDLKSLQASSERARQRDSS
jgi:predicted ATP-binding protein involved in virulence